MRKITKILSLVLVLVMLASCFVACEGKKTTTTTQKVDVSPLAGTYDITMWVSELPGVKELTLAQIDAFEAANPGVIINASIEGVTEADAGSKVVADVASAPDIYCFAQDQLARLVQAAALAAPTTTVAANLKANNDKGSVAAASVAGTLYAYPMTSDNGFFMYYDTSIISEEDAEDMTKLIAACEAAGKKFRFPLENGWYTASFFFATRCHSTWTMDADGNFNAVDDDFNSDAGLVSMKGMMELAQSTSYDSDNNDFTDAAVIITGIWAADAAAEHFGENLGVTDLPSFTVDGIPYHLGSYTGNKLMGVKPQTDAKRATVLSLLAEYLTGEECQLQRFDELQWGPSNLAAQASDAVQANESLAALAKQNEYGQPQGQIHGSWWDFAALLGADAKAAKSEADLQTALDAYEASINGVLERTDAEKMAWSVIGDMEDTAWKVDFPMVQVDDTTWITETPISFVQGQGFKLRRGADWAVQVGAEGKMKTSSFEPANISAEQTGKFNVKLTWDGTSTTATVELIPVE